MTAYVKPIYHRTPASRCFVNCTKCWCGVKSMADVDVFLGGGPCRLRLSANIITHFILCEMTDCVVVCLSTRCLSCTVAEPQLSLLWPFSCRAYTDNSCLTWILCRKSCLLSAVGNLKSEVDVLFRYIHLRGLLCIWSVNIVAVGSVFFFFFL